MDRLAVEVLQLIFNELDYPAPFAATSRRYLHFSQDPYVRARYFLARHGSIQALFFALGRPSVLTERVLDVLLTSGAHLSRYLVQLAAHHYFRTPVPFIKHPWVKLLPFPVFAHFLQLAAHHLGDFSHTKGEDDGSIFCLFVKESRMPLSSRTISPDAIVEILDKYKFMPFCDKDPIMAQFPLALAIEPRLLPLAVANGFRMDSSYRDYVFRRMFERSSSADWRKILHNVRELCQLDLSMFVSRTVAAEICLEAQANPAAYSALKALDRNRELRFELSALVHDLIKNFVNTRSVTAESSAAAIQYLYRDFLGCSSSDPTVRLVLLLSVFTSPSHGVSAATAHANLQSLNLTPLTRHDLLNMLLSPFIEQFSVIGSYSSVFLSYTPMDIKDLLASVAVSCLPRPAKGTMLKAILKRYPDIEASISSVICEQYRLSLDMLPPSEDERACLSFYSRLCGDLYTIRKNAFIPRRVEKPSVEVKEGTPQGDTEMAENVTEEAVSISVVEAVVTIVPELSSLGRISQLTLTAAIHNDDLNTARRRRYASAYSLSQYPDFSSLLPYPADVVQVGRWLAGHFGPRHPVTAELMKHVIVNQPTSLCTHYIAQLKVPVTLAHFKLLAHLGRSPAFVMFNAIEDDAQFFESEYDYLTCCTSTNKAETLIAASSSDHVVSLSSTSRRKRPRRSAASVRSYAVPYSDEEDGPRARPKALPVESEMAKWIRHLSALHRDEIRKFNERKKRAEQEGRTVELGRLVKNDFVRSLGPRLRDWRKRESERLKKLAELAKTDCGEPLSEEEDDDTEYVSAAVRRTKRRRTSVA